MLGWPSFSLASQWPHSCPVSCLSVHLCFTCVAVCSAMFVLGCIACRLHKNCWASLCCAVQRPAGVPSGADIGLALHCSAGRGGGLCFIGGNFGLYVAVQFWGWSYPLAVHLRNTARTHQRPSCSIVYVLELAGRFGHWSCLPHHTGAPGHQQQLLGVCGAECRSCGVCLYLHG